MYDLYNGVTCPKCGRPFVDDGSLTAGQEVCKCYDPTLGGITGWICPVCGAGLSPFTVMCPCTQNPFNITSQEK